MGIVTTTSLGIVICTGMGTDSLTGMGGAPLGWPPLGVHTKPTNFTTAKMVNAMRVDFTKRTVKKCMLRLTWASEKRCQGRGGSFPLMRQPCRNTRGVFRTVPGSGPKLSKTPIT